MKKHFFSHHIFLTPEQIEGIQDREVETVGHCVPVTWENGETDEPAEEVFCLYKIIPGYPSVRKLKDGFYINIAEQSSLLPIERDGCGFLSMCYKELIDGTVNVHQIVICPISHLEDSLLALRLNHHS